MSFFLVRRALWRKCQAPALPRAISLPSRYNLRVHPNSFRLRSQYHFCDRRSMHTEHSSGFCISLVSRCFADHCLYECIVTMRVDGAALAPASVAVPMFEPALLSRLCVSCPLAIHFLRRSPTRCLLSCAATMTLARLVGYRWCVIRCSRDGYSSLIRRRNPFTTATAFVFGMTWLFCDHMKKKRTRQSASNMDELPRALVNGTAVPRKQSIRCRFR